MKVIILSGIPGSGKTTYIKDHFDPADTVVCSADDYHTDEEGVYRFNPKNIALAHNECLSLFLDVFSMTRRPDTLIVDNTNLSAWEISPYYRLAEIHGCQPEIIRLWCDPIVAVRRNVHDVPLSTVFHMYQTMLSERLPGHWKVKTVIVENE